MQTLHEYILNNLRFKLLIKDSTILRNADFNGLNHILFHCFIENNSKSCALPRSKATWSSIESSHNEIIDECIFHLIECNYTNNILTFGYKLAKDSNVVSKLFCYSTNTNVSLIKGKEWCILHELIGTSNFMQILINTSLFYYNGKYFRQIIGNPANSPQTAAPWSNQKFYNTRGNIRSIDWRTMLYRRSDFPIFDRILPGSSNCLWEEMFGIGYFDIGIKASKRTVKISNFLFSSIQGAHLKIKYRRIIANICAKHNGFETPVKTVIQLIIVLLRKTFSIQLIGTRRNYSILCKSISLLSKKPLNARVPFQKLFEGIQTKDVNWISSPKNQVKSKLHVEEYKFKRKIYEDFYFWLLDKYIPRLICSIFYVTEISSTQRIAFILHEKWNKKTDSFLEQYFDEHLVANKDCNEHRSFKYSEFNHRNLRVVPKKRLKDFRVIATPSKGIDDSERADYNDYVKNVLKPTKTILERIRMERKTSFEKISSTLQIPPLVSRFKTTLMKHNNGSLPILHFIKFDMASCFDSIPISKVIKLIDAELENERQFLIRSHEVVNTDGTQSRKKYLVNGDYNFCKNELIIDLGKTFKLTGADIRKVLEMEFFKTALHYRGKCFLRKEGINQGAPLSSVMVDIFYDDLLEFYDVFKSQQDENTLILKLADDFMVISDSVLRIEKIRHLAIRGFAEYNALVNKEKLEFVSSTDREKCEISFCALQMNIQTLEIWKEESNYNIITSYFGSSRELYLKLLWLLDMRLSYNLFDERLNSWEVMLKHLKHATINLARTFVVLFAGKDVTTGDFTEFLASVLEKINTSLKSAIALSTKQSHDFKRETLAGFSYILKPRRKEFPTPVNILKQLEFVMQGI